MHTKEKEFNRVIEIWHKVVEAHNQELRQHLTDLEISSLSACFGDCFESFYGIFYESLKNIDKAPSNNYDNLHENIADIFWELNHIKNHIVASEKGFTELMNLLASKTENKEEKFSKGKD